MNISDYLWGSEETWIARHNGLLISIFLITMLALGLHQLFVYRDAYIYRGEHTIPFQDCVKNNGTNIIFVKFSTFNGLIDCVATADYYVSHGYKVQRYGINDEDWIVLEKN